MDEFSGANGPADDDGWQVVSPDSFAQPDAGTGSDSDGGSGGPRKRGRKPGSGTAKSEAGASVSSSFDIKDVLVSLTSLIAVRTQLPSVELTKDEAAKLQKAVKLVEKHHKISMSQRHMDYMAAAWMVGEVLMTKGSAVYMEARAKKNKSPPSQEATDQAAVLPFLRQQG